MSDAIGIDRAVAEAIEAVEREAWLDIFAAAPLDYAADTGLLFTRLGEAAALAGLGVPINEMNRVLGLGTGRPLLEADLDIAIAWLSEHAAPGWALQLPPHAAPRELGAWLDRRSLRSSGTGWAKFHRDAAAAAADIGQTALTIRQVDTGEGRAFGETVQAGFGLPPHVVPWFAELPGRAGWNCYLAFDGSRPVAAAAMFIAGAWAWMGIDATLGDARGKGAQSALIARRLADGRSRQLAGFTAETANPLAESERGYTSFHNYRRAGFGRAYVRANYKPGAD